MYLIQVKMFISAVIQLLPVIWL